MTEPTRSPTLQADWFDGQSSRARPAQVRLVAAPGGTELHLRALDGAAEAHRFTHQQVGWPERWGNGRPPPRVLVDLGPQGSLQIADVAGWQAALQAVGHRATVAERLQTRWSLLLGALLVSVLALWAFYRWGTPWAATQLTRAVPLSWEQSITAQAMQQLDESYLKPTKLAPERQAELRAAFNRLVAQLGPDLPGYRNYRPPLKLELRSGMPPNAFALPGGTVVLTDAMVEKARTIPGTGDDALIGVLAHEIGHVQHRHGTRLVVEQGVLGVGLGLALGDVSSVVSTGASLLTGLAYRRSHEIESDCYAVAMLRKTGLPTAPMADLLLALDAGGKAHGNSQKESKTSGTGADPAAKTPKKSTDVVTPRRGSDWLSTHPDTHGRAERLKAGLPQGCPRAGG